VGHPIEHSSNMHTKYVTHTNVCIILKHVVKSVDLSAVLQFIMLIKSFVCTVYPRKVQPCQTAAQSPQWKQNDNELHQASYIVYHKTVQARYHRCYTCCQRCRHRQSTTCISTYSYFLLWSAVLWAKMIKAKFDKVSFSFTLTWNI